MNKVMDYVGQPIFTQILSLIDDPLISSACSRHKSDKHAKKLCFKDPLTAMLYSTFARCTTLREIEAGLELCHGKLNHLNLKKVPARSTLSDGNKKRNSEVFETLYQSLYQKYKYIISDSLLKQSIASKLYILDSTTISLFKAILKPAGRKSMDWNCNLKVETFLRCYILFR